MSHIKHCLLAIALIISAACSTSKEKPGNYTLSGTIKNFKGSSLQLNELTPGGLKLMDSIPVSATGKFTLNKSVKVPTFAVISYGNTAVVLLIDSGTNLTLSLDAQKPEAYGVSGSVENEQLRQIMLINNTYMLQVSALEKKYADAAQQNQINATIENQIRSEYEYIMQLRTAELKKKALEIENGLVPYFVTNFLIPESDYAFLNQIDEKFYNRYSSYNYAKDLHARVQKLKGTAIGQPVSDIVLQDPYGKQLALSSLRGKYVLVDFWASWCGPCRRENPNVVRLYQKYKDKGFDIYSVSLDDNKDAWMRAINADQLLWPNHVSDLRKWNSSVVPLFNIESIPFTILIDPDGKIIDKNLRGSALEQKLQSIFNY